MPKQKRILTDWEVKLILNLYEIGKTDQQIADIIHCQKQSLQYILKNNNIACHIKRGIADSKVEESLYQDALKPGNTLAKIFWLCNRQKGTWQNVNKIEHTGDKTNPVQIICKGIDLSNLPVDKK